MNQRSAGRQTSSPKSKASVKAAPKPKAEIVLPRSLTVKQLADLLEISSIEAIKHLMRKGIMASVNQAIDYDSAASVASDLGRIPQPELELEEEGPSTVAKPVSVSKKEAKAQKIRPPVVTILGHVDHGKTSLLDAIRDSRITDSEVGAITQHIGAYQLTVNDQKITFLDTPGHEAFTAMRARGAKATDIAILVIAADDGIMPQTLEAIAHVKAAEVPIIVAINKIDKQGTDPERVKQQLAEQSLLVEEWGGEVIAIPVSAKVGTGISDLLEHILIVAEMAELKANPDKPASGVVVESKLDNTRGVLATLLVQDGTLSMGDTIVVGNAHWGKIKAMFDDEGKRVKSAGPSMPVEIMGLGEIAQAGDIFATVADDRAARILVDKSRAEQHALKVRAPTLDGISSQIRAGEVKGLSLIIKADVQGSIEPIKSSLERLENEEVKVRVIHSGSGSITETDIMLAIASNAIIVGFNTRPEPRAKKAADADGVEIRCYQIIYKLIEDIEKTVQGMLEPTYIDVVVGHAEVRALFAVKSGKIAGCYVTDGKVNRGSLARVLRDGQSIHESSVTSLRHLKDNVSVMSAGSECGIGIEGFSDFTVGDVIELYSKEKQ